MWIWIVPLAIGTFVIAAVSVGSVTADLSVKPRRSVYDLNEAIQYVADDLPDELTARISFEEVEAVLRLHNQFLMDKGLASTRTDEDLHEELLIVTDDEQLGWILGEVEKAELELSDTDVVQILESERGYYSAIGAFGGEVG